VFEEPPREND
jgi:hypothetical protein